MQVFLENLNQKAELFLMNQLKNEKTLSKEEVSITAHRHKSVLKTTLPKLEELKKAIVKKHGTIKPEW